ncbi:superoxide dismutase [Planomonospora sphaerica]|uniref:Superoxide dismutase n=1 Tax=Planomonospora sphaerica TaxID=161355 RepID=A0A171DI50_9ACTN|nr:superoxide dismutase [Planomonospora sphaerica]
MAIIPAYTLPGEKVMPEGIAYSSGHGFYAGSTTDGTIFRGRLDDELTQVWQPPGKDARTCVLGLAVHRNRWLVACGGATGHLFVYDLADSALLARRTVPATDTLLNDVWTVGEAAFVTDSVRPVLWRLPLGTTPQAIGEPEIFADLSGAGANAFLNGITATADGTALLVAAQGTGTLWRVETASGAVEQVRLPDGYRFCADGLLLLDDRLLFGLVNETRESRIVFSLAVVALDADARKAVPVGRWDDPRFDTPTTIALAQQRLLVVNSQLTRAEPAAPFHVISMDLPPMPPGVITDDCFTL